MIFLGRRFLQKTNEPILLYYYETSGGLVFVPFLEEIEDTKNTFLNYLTLIRLNILLNTFNCVACILVINHVVGIIHHILW